MYPTVWEKVFINFAWHIWHRDRKVQVSVNYQAWDWSLDAYKERRQAQCT